MELEYRPERPEDFRAVEEVTREAFWNHYVPGCCEHYLVHILRESEVFIRELDTVAVLDGDIVGNIVYVKAHIQKDDGTAAEVISFGPISVLPEFQGKGIGSGLIRHTKELAAVLGYHGILIYGDPDYYCRVGFVPAETYGIGTADHMYADALLACELVPGALSDSRGCFLEAGVYEVEEQDVLEFDKSFPERKKLKHLPSQERFIQLANRRRPI